MVVTFDAKPTTTRCPSEQQCVVTVPPPPAGATSAEVRVRTSAGTSNALTFRYR